MSRRPIDVRVAGQNLRVVSTAPAADLERLAGMVDAKVAETGARGKPQAQAILLAAMALAHEVEEERARREALERKTRDFLRRTLVRIDEALDAGTEGEAHGEVGGGA